MTRYLVNMHVPILRDPPGQLNVRSEGIRVPRAGHVTLMLPEWHVSCLGEAQTKAKHSWTQRLQILGESLFKVSQVVLSRTVHYISGQLRSHWVETDWLTMDGKTINAWLSLHNDQLQDLMFLPLSCQATSSTPKGSIWPNACKRANMTGFKRGRDTDIRSPKTWAAWQIIIWAAAIVVIRSGFCIRK